MIMRNWVGLPRAIGTLVVGLSLLGGTAWAAYQVSPRGDAHDKAGALQKQGNCKDAILFYRQFVDVWRANPLARESAPYQGEGPANLGYCLAQLGEYEAALQHYDRGLLAYDEGIKAGFDFSFGKGLTMTWRAETLAFLSRFDEARALLAEGHRLKGESVPAYLQQKFAAFEAQNREMNRVLKAGADMETLGNVRGALEVYLQALTVKRKEYGSFSLYSNSFLRVPDRLWNSAIDNALKLSPPPPVPEEARKHAIFAQTAVKNAKQPSDLKAAREEYYRSLSLAPWWADVWVNLSAVQEELGAYGLAAESLQTYLRAAPIAPDRAAVQTKLYELQYKVQQRDNIS